MSSQGEQAYAVLRWAYEDPAVRAAQAVAQLDQLAAASPGDPDVTDAGTMAGRLASAVQRTGPGLAGQIGLAAWEHEERDKAGKWYHGRDHQYSPGDLISPEHYMDYYPDEVGEPKSEQKVRRIMFTSDMGAAGRYGSHVYEVEPTGSFHDHPYEKGTKVTGAPLRVVREVGSTETSNPTCPHCGCPTATIGGQIGLTGHQ
jgi:Rifampin ADP-ribosyl transferase